MKRPISLLFILLMLILIGCDMAGPEERAIREMVKTFVAAIDTGDEDLALACIIDLNAFNALNPDASVRSDGDSYVDSFLADLIHSYRSYVRRYEGREVLFKKLLLGHRFHQYKGFSSFKNNEVIIEVDGVEEAIDIGAIVRIGDKWRIVELFGEE